jgi:hypothetical protein
VPIAKRLETPEQRAARKAAKRGRAARRLAFTNDRLGNVDQRALGAAFAARSQARDLEVFAARDAAAAAVVAAANPAPRGTRGGRRRLAERVDDPTGGSDTAKVLLRPRSFPTDNVFRWVPIGPSVTRRGQAEGRPRVSGRIRDLAVDATGTRAYAATAKGGVWYTSDAGTTWDPVGGWGDRARTLGGDVNAQSCGCILVAFGATRDLDVVLVGTGEPVPAISPSGGTVGGIGVLSAIGPAAAAIGAQPWELGTGIGALEGLGIFRLARHPAATAGSIAAATVDRVAAATSRGLFIGTRTHMAAVLGPNPAPEHDEYLWVVAAGLIPLINGPGPYPPPPPVNPRVTDVQWIPGGANGRLYVAIRGRGVAFSDNLGATFTWVTGLSMAIPPAAFVPSAVRGRLSLARSPGGNLYVLGEDNVAQPTAWQIANPTAAAPAAVAAPGLPTGLDTNGNPVLWGTQRDYDQSIAVDQVGGVDRVAVGGSVIWTGTDWSASLWVFDVVAGPALVPSPQVSRVGPPLPGPPPAPPAVDPSGDGADQPGLVGNNLHGDVHALVWTGAPGAPRQLWCGNDGGVFVSAQGGRVNTFLPRVTGLAVLEPGFIANHPTSSHFVAAGFQDNGTQVRVGDTVWEETFEGDGGGTVFHPTRSQFVVTQWTQGTWNAQPSSGYIDPIARSQGGPGNATLGTENANAQFYSGAAAIARSTTEGRIAIGTDRVWVTDNVGAAVQNTWRCLPSATGAATDPRANANPNSAANLAIGQPPGALGAVVTLKWASPTVLLALYQNGIVNYTNTGGNNWTVTVITPSAVGGPTAGPTTFTDIAPVPPPGTMGDFFLTTTGEVVAPPGQPRNAAIDTCWFYNSTANTFLATTLRNELDAVGAPAASGPCDPAYSVVVEQVLNPAPQPMLLNVYVGTATGVWLGIIEPVAPLFLWAPFVNGLPQAVVQDLQVWPPPIDHTGAAVAPRLLRAAVQSRGVWEVDVTGAEPTRTYVRVHARDDRRTFPTPMQNPRRAPTAAPEPTFASPDITVRPRWPRGAAPTWQLGAGNMSNTAAPPYQLWTFQTAFRWIYPSIAADGRWTDQLGDLIELHRATPASGLTPGRRITQAVWNQVLVNTRIDAAGALSAAVGDPLAVYRPPWQSSAAPGAVATEIDLMELVQPPGANNGVINVYREPSTVEVLIHHRDTRPLAANDAWVLLLWQSGKSAGTLTGLDLSALPAYVVAAAATVTPNPLPATPAGWTLQAGPAGAAIHRLPTTLDARIPRAVSIDVDFSGVTAYHHVLLVAVVGSSIDMLTALPQNAPVTVNDLVRNWPYAAMRLARVIPRPA